MLLVGVVITLSLNIFVFTINNIADSTYPMVVERWNMTRLSSVSEYQGNIKQMGVISYSRTHICMYASARSTLLMKTVSIFGSAAITHLVGQYRALSNSMDYLGKACLVHSFSMIHERLYMSRDLRTHCVIEARGDIQRQRRLCITFKGVKDIWLALI